MPVPPAPPAPSALPPSRGESSEPDTDPIPVPAAPMLCQSRPSTPLWARTEIESTPISSECQTSEGNFPCQTSAGRHHMDDLSWQLGSTVNTRNGGRVTLEERTPADCTKTRRLRRRGGSEDEAAPKTRRLACQQHAYRAPPAAAHQHAYRAPPTAAHQHATSMPPACHLHAASMPPACQQHAGKVPAVCQQHANTACRQQHKRQQHSRLQLQRQENSQQLKQQELQQQDQQQKLRVCQKTELCYQTLFGGEMLLR